MMTQNRLPSWFRQPLPDKRVFDCIGILKELKVNTVCKNSLCPNLSRCFANGKLTFLLLGNICTRSCRFCNVEKRTNSSKLELDSAEPRHIGEAVKRFNLKYVILTSVSRDDLTDGGCGHFARTVEMIHSISQVIKIELLIPDFSGSAAALKEVIRARPDVIGHNLETVPRLYAKLRPEASYECSLGVLKMLKELDDCLITKSSLILGMGEQDSEVKEVIRDLAEVGTDILALGQYLSPTKEHYLVSDFLNIEKFQAFRDFALSLGFKAVLSAPLVRSSYQAEDAFNQVKERERQYCL